MIIYHFLYESSDGYKLQYYLLLYSVHNLAQRIRPMHLYIFYELMLLYV